MKEEFTLNHINSEELLFSVFFPRNMSYFVSQKKRSEFKMGISQMKNFFQ